MLRCEETLPLMEQEGCPYLGAEDGERAEPGAIETLVRSQNGALLED